MDNKLELVSVKIMIQLIKSHNLLQVHNCSHKPFRQMVNKLLSLQAHNKHDKPIQLNNGADSLISTAYLKVVDLTGVNVVHYMKAWRYNGSRAGGYMSRQEGMWHCIICYPPHTPPPLPDPAVMVVSLAHLGASKALGGGCLWKDEGA